MKPTQMTLFSSPVAPDQPPSPKGKGSNGDNRLSAEDRPAHDWYRFVLSYPPHLVRQYLTRFGMKSGRRVLDPFCGTGTTLVECKKLGIESVGVEANPMAYFASSVKTCWEINPDEFEAAAEHIAGLATAAIRKTLAKPKATLKSLPEPAFEILLRGSISPRPLHKVLVLMERLNPKGAGPFHRHYLLALAKALVDSIGNIRFGPEVGITPPKDDAPVVEAWLARTRAMADDLRLLRPAAAVPATVHCFDARKVAAAVGPNSIDAVITSPPYPNEKDYTRTTRLESVLLGFIKDKQELRAFKQSLIRSNTRNVFKKDRDDEMVDQLPEVNRLAHAIEARRLELGKTSGFERLYARVTKLYFGGMARHLADLRGLLKQGAKLAYVVGDQASYLRIMIRTGQILADIAERLGYRVVGIDLFRTRLATATREQLREEVVVLEWPGAI